MSTVELPTEGGAVEGTTDQGTFGGETAADDRRAGADSREVGAVVSEAPPASQEGGVGEPSAGAPPMPMPHRDHRHIETGMNCYPEFLARVADVCRALNKLSDPDLQGIESTYSACPEGGVIGLYNEEGASDDDPHVNLHGWLVPDGDVGWSFIARKPQWSEGTPSDAAEPTR